MPNRSGSHPNDDALELYSLGRLSEDELATVEEHLLICAECRERVVDVDVYVAAMQGALRRNQQQERAPGGQRMAWLSWLFALPKPVWAGALAAALALVFLFSWQQTPVEPFAVQLQALRGAGSSAPAGRPLVLNLDLTGLDTSPEYVVELANASGDLLWTSVARPAGNQSLSVLMEHSLRRGRYWLRVYSASANTKADLLREYDLTVQ